MTGRGCSAKLDGNSIDRICGLSLSNFRALFAEAGGGLNVAAKALKNLTLNFPPYSSSLMPTRNHRIKPSRKGVTS